MLVVGGGILGNAGVPTRSELSDNRYGRFMRIRKMEERDADAVVELFRSGDDTGVCGCGWLEEEHLAAGAVITPLARARRVRSAAMPMRRAS